MPRFAANLSMLFTEEPFLDRFKSAAQSGFTAVEFLFPYAYAAQDIRQQLDQNGLTLVLHNLPAGDWDAGERGVACDPTRVAEFRAGVARLGERGFTYDTWHYHHQIHEMTALAQKASGFPKERVIGQAGVLDTARFTNFVAEATGAETKDVRTLTLGSHGETMVPVPSVSTVNGKKIVDVLGAEKVAELVDRTRNGGAEIVALLKTGSAYYAPSAAVARMAKAVHEDSGAVFPVCAWVDGQFGISGVYLGVEAKLGKGGIKQVVETPLDAEELENLKVAAEAVRAKQADVENL